MTTVKAAVPESQGEGAAGKHALVPLPGAAANDLHQQIMNIQPMRSYLDVPGEEDMRHAYLLGHRDARHVAAELAAALPTPPDGWQETQEAARLLLLELNDYSLSQMAFSIGNTNAAVIRLRRDNLQTLLPPPPPPRDAP